MTAEELRAIVDATRNLTRWDSSVPTVRMIDTMWKHADALVALVAASERLRDHTVPQHVAVCDVLSALHEVHAVGKEAA